MPAWYVVVPEVEAVPQPDHRSALTLACRRSRDQRAGKPKVVSQATFERRYAPTLPTVAVEEWVTLQDAAAQLHVSDTWLRRRAAEFGGEKRGRRWWFPARTVANRAGN